jgi:hypothetical protein
MHPTWQGQLYNLNSKYGGKEQLKQVCASVFLLANPQPANLQHRVEIGRLGLVLRVEIARVSTRKVCNLHLSHVFVKKSPLAS